MPSAASGAVARYSRPAIVLHWLIFLLVALALFAIEVRGPRGSESRALWTGIHMWAGVSVLCLTALRLIWRLVHGVPAAEQGSGVLAACARAMHWLFYIVLLAQPLLGILMINYGGNPVRLMGTGITISLAGADDAARGTVHAIHVFMGNALYYLIGLHALAALWHQYVLKDGTLRKML
ncbi:cytochrome B [Bordetella bronchialis]|uniref:Cytochrome B n=2 Tax=Bordetella bronchialis TaxID=463025 RepID=A0A193G4H5_9BORD|nr:cytochrome b [Bordetella bronchialis]ANN69450.1 cytochrome B [Bordetella bronchialis]ANN74603.1 cytochrome B [Bordetella bronchialis]